MKKLLLLVVVALFGLTACSFDFQFGDAEVDKVAVNETVDNEEQVEKESEEAAEPEEEEGAGDGEVVINVPADTFEGMTSEEVVAFFEMDGITDITVNDDGSYTLKMTQAEQDAILEDLTIEAHAGMAELVGGFAPEFITEITTNPEFTELLVSIKRDSYDGDMEGFVLEDFSMFGINYQMLNGVDMEEIDFEIVLLDDATGEEFERWSAKDE